MYFTPLHKWYKRGFERGYGLGYERGLEKLVESMCDVSLLNKCDYCAHKPKVIQQAEEIMRKANSK